MNEWLLDHSTATSTKRRRYQRKLRDMATPWRGRDGAERDPESNGEPPEFEDAQFEDVYTVDFDPTSDEGYSPPPPPPLPFVAPATVLGSLAAAIGAGLLFYPGALTSFLGVSTTLALLLAALLFGIGAATLIGRLRNPDPDDPEDPEAGAKV